MRDGNEQGLVMEEGGSDAQCVTRGFQFARSGRVALLCPLPAGP